MKIRKRFSRAKVDPFDAPHTWKPPGFVISIQADRSPENPETGVARHAILQRCS